jgi:hypothetical protein
MKAEKFDAILTHLRKIGLLDRRKTVCIYNWSEPTLNPEINEILKCLGRRNLFGTISSNFVAPWSIDLDNYRYIDTVILSLCSLKEEHYRRIYGADLQTTLNNFKDFLEKRKRGNPDITVRIHWLRYKFNIDEQQEAREYFTKLIGKDIVFVDDYSAYVIDLQAYLSYCRSGGKILEGYNLEEVRKDLIGFDDDLIFAKNSKKCCWMMHPAHLTITEEGQLAQCCVISSNCKEYNMGDILTLSKEDITRLKANAPICKECEGYGLPYYLFYGMRKV